MSRENKGSSISIEEALIELEKDKSSDSSNMIDSDFIITDGEGELHEISEKIETYLYRYRRATTNTTVADQDSSSVEVIRFFLNINLISQLF